MKLILLSVLLLNITFQAEARVVVLASEQKSPSAIAGDDTAIYWFNQAEGKIYKKNLLDSSGPVEFANPGIFQAIDLHNLVLRDGYLYWANYSYSKLQRKKLSGNSEIEDVATGVGAPLAISVDEKYIYWSNYSCGINKVERSGAGQPIDLGTGYCSLANISTSKDFIFFTASENMKAKVLRMSKNGGEAEVLADGFYNSIYSTYSFNEELIWSDQGGAIYKVGRSINQPVKIIKDNVVRAIRDENFIFYVSQENDSHSIKKYDLQKQTVTTLAVGSYIQDLVLADHSLFWVDKSEGTISKFDSAR